MASLWSRVLIIVSMVIFYSTTLVEAKMNLQWAICDQDYQNVLHKLGHDGMKPYKAHNVTYYDTSPPSYTTQGLAFRTKFHGTQPISMIKVRFLRRPRDQPREADCVYDQYGDATTFTCGLASPLSDLTPEIWSPEQVIFAERYQFIDWDALVPYGPFMNPKWKIRLAGYKAKFDDVTAMVAGKPLHIMEIEVRVHHHDRHHAHRKITRYLEERGVRICKPVQLPKTERLFAALTHQPRHPPHNSEQSILG